MMPTIERMPVFARLLHWFEGVLRGRSRKNVAASTVSVAGGAEAGRANVAVARQERLVERSIYSTYDRGSKTLKDPD